jgi:hypothetical protein
METNQNAPTRQLTPDQEALLSQRLRTCLRMALVLRSAQKTGADATLLECAMDGLINGSVVEIARSLGFEPCFVNLQRPKSQVQP